MLVTPPPFEQTTRLTLARQVQLKLCERCRAQNSPDDDLCRRCQSRLPFAIYVYPPGTRFRNKYEITRVLGHGAMGTVYQGQHLLLHRKVALKFIHPHLLAEEEQRKRFLREAATASAVDHLNAIQVLDLEITEEGIPFLVSELLEGRDLEQALAEGEEFPVPRLTSILLQVLDALEEAHQKGIVHRDLKPQNLFLLKTPDGREQVKLVDFGLARFFEKGKEESLLTAKGLTVGTPLYMSPEQIQAEELDGRADLWSVGVLLYQMLTGECPFVGSSPMSTAMSVLRDPLVIPSEKAPNRKIPCATGCALPEGPLQR